jgi:protein arginine kinase activator
MVCNICHKNSATVHFTEIINDKVIEMHVCQDCAQSKAQELSEQLNISEFLGGLTEVNKAQKKELELKCSSCSLSYEDFRKKGKLGCGDCYLTFRQQLLPLLKKIHGSVRHSGKTALPEKKEEASLNKIRELEEKLQRAIQLEEYEEAAYIRDQIKQLKNQSK